MKKVILLIAVLLLMASFSIAQIPTINSYVIDNAGILSAAAKSQLENDLRNLETSTNGVQFVIYIENEYPKDYSLEEYTLKIAEANKIGKKGNDNGVLLYIAVKDRKYRWEVGYGVESTLNSALLGRISRDYLVPNFQAGNYEQGILQTFDVTKRILLGSNDADIVALEKGNETKSDNTFIFGFILLIFIIFLLFAAFNRIKKLQPQKNKKHKDSFYHGAAWGLFTGGFGRGGFGGSGGFGGFSGGGGNFGGGGGSGGW